MNHLLDYQDSDSDNISDSISERDTNLDIANKSLIVSDEKDCDFFGLNTSSNEDDNETDDDDAKHNKVKLSLNMQNNILLSRQLSENFKRKSCEIPSMVPIIKKIKPYESKSSNIAEPSNFVPELSSNNSHVQNFFVLEIHSKLKKYLNNVPHSFIPKNKYWDKQLEEGSITSLNWSINQYSHLLLTACTDKTVKIWDIFKKEWSLLLSDHKTITKTAVWNNDASIIATGGYDKTLRLYDVTSGICIFKKECDYWLSSLKFHPVYKNLLIIGTRNLQCWDVQNNELVRNFTYRTQFDEVEDIVFLNDCKEIACCTNHISRESADRSIIVWDFNLGSLESNQIYQERYTCTCLKVHPTEKVFMAQTNGNYIALFSSIRPFVMNKYKRFEGHKISGYKILCDVSPDGRHVVSGSSDGSLYFYNYRTGKLINKFNAYSEPCTLIQYHPVIPGLIASTSLSGKLSLWQ